MPRLNSVSHVCSIPAAFRGCSPLCRTSPCDHPCNPPLPSPLPPCRLREVHDFWHVLFALPTTVSGELALKLIECCHTALPMTAAAALAGPLRLSAARRRALLSAAYPWALAAALQAKPLAPVFYEKHLAEDVAAVRRRLGITPAPAELFARHAAA